jgi:hypothetical protein
VYRSVVRVAVIGPVGRSEAQLDRALELAFVGLLADRALYLGPSDLVTRRRHRSATELGQDSPWQRSVSCIDKSAAEIERFVVAERKRLDWGKLEVPDAGGQSIVLSTERSLFVCRAGDVLGSEAASAELIISAPQFDNPAFEFRQASDGKTWLLPGSLDGAGLVVVSDAAQLSVDVYDVGGQRLGGRVVAPSA